MPVEVVRNAPHLYLNIIDGLVKMEDIAGAVQLMAKLATEHNESFYVIVSDASAVRNIPFDIKGLRAIAERDPRIAGYLIVNAPYIAKVAANIITKVSPVVIELFTSTEAALERAHQVISERAQLEHERTGTKSVRR